MFFLKKIVVIYGKYLGSFLVKFDHDLTVLLIPGNQSLFQGNHPKWPNYSA